MNAIQWITGANGKPIDEYPDLFNKIQKANKLSQLNHGTFDELMKVSAQVPDPTKLTIPLLKLGDGLAQYAPMCEEHLKILGII